MYSEKFFNILGKCVLPILLLLPTFLIAEGNYKLHLDNIKAQKSIDQIKDNIVTLNSRFDKYERIFN